MRLRYKIKPQAINPKVDITTLYGQPCYLGVSISNPIFQGDEVAGLMEWIDKRFSHCSIVIGDYLDRINQSVFQGLSQEQAIVNTKIIGDHIHERFLSEFENFSGKFTIEHWEKLYFKSESQQLRETIEAVLKSNSAFETFLLSSSKEYVERQIARGNNPTVTYDQAVYDSMKYIIEEMSVFGYLIENGFRIQVYPGSTLPALKNLAYWPIPELQNNLAKGIYIDLTLKRRKVLQN